MQKGKNALVLDMVPILMRAEYEVAFLATAIDGQLLLKKLNQALRLPNRANRDQYPCRRLSNLEAVWRWSLGREMKLLPKELKGLTPYDPREKSSLATAKGKASELVARHYLSFWTLTRAGASHRAVL